MAFVRKTSPPQDKMPLDMGAVGTPPTAEAPVAKEPDTKEACQKAMDHQHAIIFGLEKALKTAKMDLDKLITLARRLQ